MNAYQEAMAELNELQGSDAIIYGLPRISLAEESVSSASAGACMGQAPATFRDTVLTWSSALMVLLGSAMFVLWAGMKVWDFYLKVRR